MLKFIAVSLVLSVLSGCAVTIKDYDAEKLEYEQINRIKKAQSDPFNAPSTPSYVKLIENNGVYVEAIKLTPIKGHQGIMLDVWVVDAVNTNDKSQCVTINWKLQDFDFETGLPYEFLVPEKKSIKIGRMTQTIWSFDGAAIAIPPSGYIDGMRVRDAKFELSTGKLTCDELEKDIQTPKETRN
jgi:hypothetical protein